jgi:hypothetical protein
MKLCISESRWQKWRNSSPSESFTVHIMHVPFFFYLPLEKVLPAVTFFSPAEQSNVS